MPALTPADLALHARLGIEAEVLEAHQVRRVDDREAREVFALNGRHRHGRLDGVLYPYLMPGQTRPVGHRLRRDHPEIEDGKPKNKYVSGYGDVRHLYFATMDPALLSDVTVPVVFVEAEKSALSIVCAARRAGRQVLAIALGGCWNGRGRIGKTVDASGARVDEVGPLPDFGLITWPDRDTIIVADANISWNKSVQAARRWLASDLAKRGAQVRVVDLPVENGINGPDDFIGRHGDPAFWTLIDNASDADSREKESQATAIVRLATQAGAEFWHTPGSDGYISAKFDGHVEHYPLLSRAAKDYLGRLFFTETRKSPNASALQDALNTLSGIARFDGAEHDVHVRVASRDSCIYLDLCDPLWRAVEITKNGWQVVTNPPVRFRRPRGVLPLPEPQRGGSIQDLRSFVNVATDDATDDATNDDDFILMVAWVLAALRGRGPYPILILMAEQGAAKTTATRVLRRLCDPNDSNVRRPPKNTEDLMIAASNGHVVAFDNLSRLPEELSDNLSVLATGGGFAVRQLFTNSEEVIFNAQRPIVFNGISQVATRGDLLDRAIVVTLPPIPEKKREYEDTFWKAFDAALPRILGALLDAVVVGLQRVAHVHLEHKPRMADFAIWGVATEAACPWRQGAFLDAYTANRKDAIEAMLDGDPVADAVNAIVPWTGTASDLLAKLNTVVPERLTTRKDWFSKPRQVSDALRRLAPGLRRTGIEVVFSKQGRKRTRLIQIKRSESSAASASSARPDLQGDSADADADESPLRPHIVRTSSAENVNGYAGEDAADAADAVKPAFAGLDHGTTGTTAMGPDVDQVAVGSGDGGDLF